MTKLLATLVATLTNHDRYFPEFEWSYLWTHNIFRFLGSLFGEYCGIRPNIYTDATGEVAYTLEAQIALFEVYVRAILKKNFALKIVWIPQYQLAGLSQGGMLPYRFAIALDNYSDNGTVNSNTFNKTCTGSNLGLVAIHVGDINASDTLTGITYNAVAMLFGANGRFTGDRWQDMYLLAGPATGSNAVTSSGSTFNNLGAISYTGCATTSAALLDSHNAAFVATNTTVTVTTTVVASGCWLVAYSRGGGGYTSGTGTVRGTNPWIGGDVAFDSNASVGTGSQSMTINQASSQYQYTVLSLAPVAAAAVIHSLSALGAGA